MSKKPQPINENMMIADPSQVCDTYECGKDAHVMLYSSQKGWIRICPECLGELQRLQTRALKHSREGE